MRLRRDLRKHGAPHVAPGAVGLAPAAGLATLLVSMGLLARLLSLFGRRQTPAAAAPRPPTPPPEAPAAATTPSAAPAPSVPPPAARIRPQASAEKRAQTLQALADLRQIPALQSLATQFTRTLNRSEVSVPEVVDAIRRDSALCVRILGLANSAAVGSERRIEDLDTAVQMLGVARVRKAAQALFTLRDAGQGAAGVDWRHLWVHALATAELADEMGRRFGVPEELPVFQAALLHDVGKIVLATVAPDDYRATLAAAWAEEGRIEDLERATFGVTHREAGALFATQHRLSPAMIQTIAHHDRPEDATEDGLVVALTAAANHLAKHHGIGFSGSRLTPEDGEFSMLSAWDVVQRETGWRPDTEALEEEMAAFAAQVRLDLRSLQEQAKA